MMHYRCDSNIRKGYRFRSAFKMTWYCSGFFLVFFKYVAKQSECSHEDRGYSVDLLVNRKHTHLMNEVYYTRLNTRVLLTTYSTLYTEFELLLTITRNIVWITSYHLSNDKHSDSMLNSCQMTSLCRIYIKMKWWSLS